MNYVKISTNDLKISQQYPSMADSVVIYCKDGDNGSSYQHDYSHEISFKCSSDFHQVAQSSSLSPWGPLALGPPAGLAIMIWSTCSTVHAALVANLSAHHLT